MSNKKIIKKVLLEVAGISFEVRKWANEIENYVKDYVAAEKAKMPKQTYTKPQIQEPKKYNIPIVTPPKEEEIYGEGVEFTHFESHGGDVYASAKIYGYNLYINSDVSTDFPNIKKIIQDKLFEVELDGEGGFTVDTVGSSFPDQYLNGILEIIEDCMVMGESFYTNNYDEVFAVVGDEENFDVYTESISDDDYVRPSMRDYGSSYDGYYSYSPQPKIEKIEINGKDFPDAYQGFSVDKWVITNSNRIEYDHWKSGYDEFGNYVVYLNMPMSSVGGSALVHEIKHAYDDWNRMRKGKQPLRSGWEIQNIYTPDFEKLVLGGSLKLSPMINPIIRYYYLGSKLESPAYLENEYDNVSLSGNYRDTAKKLMNFRASNFLDKNGNPAKGLQESWTQLITEYNIPFFRKFKNVIDFLNYTEKYFNKRGRDIIKRIDKMRYVHNKPEPVYIPRKITYNPSVKPASTPVNPADGTKISNQVEIDRLDKQIDRLEDEWEKLRSEDAIKNKLDLDELDVIIRGLIKKRNSLDNFDLPF